MHSLDLHNKTYCIVSYRVEQSGHCADSHFNLLSHLSGRNIPKKISLPKYAGQWYLGASLL